MTQLRWILLSMLCVFSLLSARFQVASAQTSNTVSVSAQVPLLPQHVFGIQKNSHLEHTYTGNHVRDGSDVRFEVSLLGLKNLPQKNRDVTITLTPTDTQHSVKVTQVTDSTGLASFKLPISYSLVTDQYSVSFSTIIESTHIDLFSEIYIEIIRPRIMDVKELGTYPYRVAALPLDKPTNLSYTHIHIFATLNKIEKTYDSANKTFVPPGTIGAAARDGPVV